MEHPDNTTNQDGIGDGDNLSLGMANLSNTNVRLPNFQGNDSPGRLGSVSRLSGKNEGLNLETADYQPNSSMRI